MIFLPKNLSRNFFRLKSTALRTEYNYRRYFFKNVPLIGTVVTYLAKYQYRYRRYF